MVSNLLAKNCPSETVEENDVQELDHVTEQSHSTKPLDTDLSTEDVVPIETVPTVREHLSSVEDNGQQTFEDNTTQASPSDLYYLLKHRTTQTPDIWVSKKVQTLPTEKSKCTYYFTE